MKIKELFKFLPHSNLQGKEEIEIEHLVYDSRKAKKNTLFVALKGEKTDGHYYIPDVLEKGAYVLAEESRKEQLPQSDKIFFTQNTRIALAYLSKAYFHSPDKDLFIIGVTGTNGKTTTTYMVRSILEESGVKTGIIGTIQYQIGDKTFPANNTTPESFEIYQLFAQMRDAGCQAVAMEVSSHALSMHRVEAIDFNIAIFTNLTQDHLDYHKTMEDYFQAKLLFFDLLKKSAKQKKIAIINSDIPYFPRIKEKLNTLQIDFQTYGMKEPADWKAYSVSLNIYHNVFSVSHHNQEFHIDTPMLGEFNIYNALSAIASTSFYGVKKDAIESGLKKISVPGRFERIVSCLGFSVIIDYAHTPDALENILKAARRLNPVNIITVFGAGGDRDKTKRPKMGAIAREYSNFIILTSDNPRSEDPMSILQEIEKPLIGFKNYEIIEDREKAIQRAIFMAEEGDLVIIAGKGHENYQIFKDKTIHFSDQETAHRYIGERENEKNKKTNCKNLSHSF